MIMEMDKAVSDADFLQLAVYSIKLKVDWRVFVPCYWYLGLLLEQNVRPRSILDSGNHFHRSAKPSS